MPQRQRALRFRVKRKPALCWERTSGVLALCWVFPLTLGTPLRIYPSSLASLAWDKIHVRAYGEMAGSKDKQRVSKANRKKPKLSVYFARVPKERKESRDSR